MTSARSIRLSEAARVFAAAAGLLLALIPVRAEQARLEALPVAGQTGPSCGFFANVPALTLASGVDISASRPFVSSVYGLRRGDFRFQRSFDKRMFYELFSIPYEVVEIEHPPQRATDLKPKLKAMVGETLDPALDEGKVFSLRVIGVFGGPHNTLLFGKSGSSYLVHDPYPGRIKKLTLDQLVDSMLVRSTTRKNRGKEVYVTHYLEVDLPSRPGVAEWLPVTRFPQELKVTLTPSQRTVLATRLKSSSDEAGPSGMAARVRHFPELDFAVLEDPDGEGGCSHVISSELKPEQLGGVLHLAKFTLNTWHLGRRSLLPVVFMEGRPWVLVAYQPHDEADRDRPCLVFDDGREIRGLSISQALRLIHADGPCYATVRLDRE